jgi:hypothetical protein
MNTVFADSNGLPYCCGVDVIGGFSSGRGGREPFDDLTQSGTGLYVSTFTNTAVQRDAYEALKKKYDILFQSKPYRNKNSGNMLFLVVYGPKKRTKKEGKSSSWPATSEAPTRARRGEKLPEFGVDIGLFQ